MYQAHPSFVSMPLVTVSMGIQLLPYKVVSFAVSF